MLSENFAAALLSLSGNAALCADLGLMRNHQLRDDVAEVISQHHGPGAKKNRKAEARKQKLETESWKSAPTKMGRAAPLPLPPIDTRLHQSEGNAPHLIVNEDARLPWFTLDVPETVEGIGIDECVGKEGSGLELRCLDSEDLHELHSTHARKSSTTPHFYSSVDAGAAAPAGTRRLFDLITPKEERFRTAFYKAVRNMLVARNLDEASAIAYKGKRAVHQVVTLQGEIISTSGTMAGGGAKARSGGMKAQLAAEPMDAVEHKALERGLADANTEIFALRARISGLKKEVTALRRSLPKLETAKRSLEMELSCADERMAALEAQLDLLREAAVLPEAAQQQVDELREAAEGHAAEYAAAEAAAKSIREEANALQKKIKDVGGPRLRRQTEKVEELNEKVAETTRAHAKARVDAKNEHKNAAKARAAAEKAVKETKALAAQRAQLKQDFTAVDDEAAACHERLQTAKAALEGEKANTKQFHTKHEKLQKKVQLAEDAMSEVQREYDGEAQEHKKNHEKIKHWDAQFKGARETYAKEVQEYAVCEGLDDDDEDSTYAEQENAAAEGGGQAAAPKRKGGRFAATLKPLAEAELEKKIANEAALCKAVGDAKHQISLLEQECTVIEGNVDMTSIVEFKKKEKEYLGNVRELDVATRAVHDAREKLEDVKKRRLVEFQAGFSHISNKLKEVYQMITLGGDADLELVDSLDPFAGIGFTVRPYNKSWKPIARLSGGEKTLASLALVFALHHCYPTPLYVMDEIDAALDFRNVSIVGNYIKERTRNAQVSGRAARLAHPQRARSAPSH
jgi:structural maintenance of chromosome 4